MTTRWSAGRMPAEDVEPDSAAAAALKLIREAMSEPSRKPDKTSTTDPNGPENTIVEVLSGFSLGSDIGVSPAAILAAVSGEMNDRTLRRHLSELADLGLARRVGRGRGARWLPVKLAHPEAVADSDEPAPPAVADSASEGETSEPAGEARPISQAVLPFPEANAAPDEDRPGRKARRLAGVAPPPDGAATVNGCAPIYLRRGAPVESDPSPSPPPGGEVADQPPARPETPPEAA